MRRTAMFGILGLLAVLAPAVPLQAQSAEMQEYVVLYRGDASAGRQAVRSAGGKIVKENMAIGMATVTSTRSDFLASVAGQPTLEGGGRNRPVGFAPPGLRPKREDAERLLEERREAAAAGRSSQPAPAPAPSEEPLGPLQWNMKMIRATPQGSYAVQPGDKRVLVGIIDTGVDGSHPDIAPNFDRALSRNFTVDVPLVDGPCELEPDRSCNDPADVDENGHGTHVAGIIGAPINGLGIAGVAPNVTLVNLRAGQDSGLFFLQSTVDALTFAGDNGIDVVNMSFYTDPWLYNCPNNPADSPIEQMEQRTVIAATQRALDYAHARGVTKVAALGNEHTDLGKPTVDTLSPDFPPGSARTRTVDNSCLDMPTEGRNVIGVSSIGPSTAKADYSNYGIEQADVSAPGGYFRDLFGTPQHRTPRPTQILSPYPRSLALEAGDIDENGLPTNDFVIRDCQAGVCAYYQYLQGTSMAAPHASGVAALIVSQFGFPDYRRNATGRTFPPGSTQQILQAMATDHACPEPRLVSYVPVGRPASWDALCEGGPSFNGFYGHGIVDALSAVTLRPRR